MAERRMFSKSVIDSDAFFDLPPMAQNLYFHLLLHADDDGFIGGPKRITRMTGADTDDLQLLVNNGFLISFDSGIVVISHWRIHNCIQKDRYKPTIYTEEKEELYLSESKVYYRIPKHSDIESENACIQDVSTLETQDSLGKISEVKDSKKEESNLAFISHDIRKEKIKEIESVRGRGEGRKTQKLTLYGEECGKLFAEEVPQEKNDFQRQDILNFSSIPIHDSSKRMELLRRMLC